MIGTNREKYEIFAISIFTNFNKPLLITTIESVTLMKYISGFKPQGKTSLFKTGGYIKTNFWLIESFNLESILSI